MSARVTRSINQSNRDLRIDLFRGLALWWILIDHLTKSWLRNVTLQRLTFSDAAELFVLLSGISAGIVYGPLVSRETLLVSSGKILRRVVVLYRTHLVMFVLVTTEAVLIAHHVHRHAYIETLGLEPLLGATYRGIAEIASLRFQPAYLDILPLYIVLLLLLCVALPCLRWPKLVLAGSAALFVMTRALQLRLPIWKRGWYFNPLSWQFLFFIGVFAALTFKASYARRRWDALAGFVLITCILLAHLHSFPIVPPQWLTSRLHNVDKEGLHPLRLISILALGWLTWRFFPANSAWLKSRLFTPFVLMGQHSLTVFCFGTFLALWGEAVLVDARDWKNQILVNVLGTAGLVASAALSAWYRESSKGTSARRAVSGHNGSLLPPQAVALKVDPAVAVHQLKGLQ